MKLNQKFIKQLRNGEIAAYNNGTVEQLRRVLIEVFPLDEWEIDGTLKFYQKSDSSADEWECFNKTKLPIKKISDFYKPEQFTGWAKDDNYPKWMGYFKDDVSKFGFNIFGEWQELDRNHNYSEDDRNRPATNEEIEATLIKEAIKRGYKKGVTCLFVGDIRKLNTSNIEYTKTSEGYGCLVMGTNIIFIEKDGQWAEIVEQPKAKTKPNPINYLVGGTEYSLNYQELKSEYNKVVMYSNEEFMQNLPQIAHLACIVAYFKGLGVQATISDEGIVHELIHLMTHPLEQTNDLAEIREKFNRLIQLV